jgi:hemolysin III
MHRGERFNTITHLLGAILAAVGFPVLVVSAASQGDPWKIVSYSVYGASLVLLYTASALYHSVHGRAKAVFRQLDHLAIYILIAGTYTPFALVTLRGAWGWTIFGLVWGLAVIGLIVDSLPRTRNGRRFLPLAVYLLMGWLCVIALGPLLQKLPMMGFVLLLAGGLFYTAGIGFYLYDSRIRHFHGIWHLFVLAGSISHFWAILRYLD